MISLLITAPSVFATKITVNTIDVSNSQTTITKLRIYCNESFVTYSLIAADNNKLIQAGAPPSGAFYYEVAVSYPSANLLRIPMVFLDSTTDGQTSKSARYTAYFVTAANKYIPYGPFSDFAIPPTFDTGVVATWSQIAVYNLGIAPIPPQTSTYTAEVIDRKIAAINGLTNPMSGQGDFIVGGPSGMPMRFAATTDGVLRFMTETGPNNLPAWTQLSFANVTTGLGYTPINKAGDTMTGPLISSGAPTLPLHLANKAYVDALAAGLTTLNGISGATNPTQNFAVGGNFPNLTITSTASLGIGTHTYNWTGSLSAQRGGLGLTSYGTGDIPYTTGPTTFTSLPAAATGNVLISGTLPSYGKVGLTTHISGILLPINGGSGANLSSGTGYFKISTSGQPAALQGTIPATDGGTGFGNYAIGDTFAANSSTTLLKITGNITTTRKFYLGVGDGSAATVPSWDVVKASDIDVSAARLRIDQGGTGQLAFTAGYLRSNGSALSSQAVPIPAADLLTTNTTNGLVYSAGTNVTTLGLGGANTLLTGTGSTPAFSGNPTITSISLLGLTSGSIPYINGSKLLTESAASKFMWIESPTTTQGNLNVKGTLKFFNTGGGNIFLANAGTSETITWNFPASRPGGTNYTLVGTPNGDGITIDMAWVAGGGGGGTPITINGSGDAAFLFTTGTTGTDFARTTNSASGTTTIAYNLPSYQGGVTTRGLLSNAAQSFDGLKTFLDGATVNALLTLATNTTLVAPIKFNSFTSLLTTPTAYTVEYDGTRLYYDNSVAARKSVAFLDDNITGTALGFTSSLAGAITGTQGATAYAGIVPRNLGGLGNDPSTPTDGYFLRYDSGSGNVLFSADGGALNGLNASNLAGGTVPLARITGLTNTNVAAGAAIDWTKISKSGSSLADLATRSAVDLSSGTLPDARLSANVQLVSERDFGCSGCSSATGYAGVVSGLLQRAEGLEVFHITDIFDYASTSGSGTAAILSTITSGANGQFLQYTGTNWINTPGINTSRSLTDGDVLKWVAGAGRWENAAPSAASGNALLDGSAHTDTDAGTVVRGDLIVGNSTPHWARLAKDASNLVLINDGTDTKWGKVNLASTSYVTGVTPPANGGTGLASGTSGGILAFTGTTTIASSALLPLNGVMIGGGVGAVPSGTAAGTANQAFRVPGAGGTPGFGAIDLASTSAVTGVLAVTNGGAPAGGTNSYVMIPDLNVATVTNVAFSNNQVRVARIKIHERIVVNKVCFTINSAGTGATRLLSVGIYSDLTSAPIIDTGPLTATATLFNATPVVGTGITLTPGDYYIAWTAFGTTTPPIFYAADIDTTKFTQLLNSGTSQNGIAANASVAGQLPATLGSITSASNAGIIVCKLQN